MITATHNMVVGTKICQPRLATSRQATCITHSHQSHPPPQKNYQDSPTRIALGYRECRACAEVARRSRGWLGKEEAEEDGA